MEANDLPFLHSQYQFYHLTVDEGLSYNLVITINQDADGFIWFGTFNGLNRFDGSKLKIYKKNPNDSTSLINNEVFKIFSDSKGYLWIGTDDGLCLYNKNYDNFKRYSLRLENRFADPHVSDIVEDSKGNLWIGTNNGLFKLNADTYQLEYINILKREDTFVNISSLLIDSKNNFWIGTIGYGLMLLDLSSLNYIQYKNEPELNSLSENYIEDLFEDTNGKIWMGMNNSNINILDPLTDNIERVIVDENELRSSRVRKIIKDKNGDIWLGTRGGLYLKRKNDLSFYRYAHNEHIISELKNNSIYDIFYDRTGSMWLGTFAGGVAHTDMYRKKITCYTSKNNNKYYLNSKIVYCFCEDKTGNIWIGTEYGGINILNKNTGVYTYLMNIPGDDNSISNNNIKCLLPDKNGDIWIGTYKGGLNKYNFNSGKIERYLLNKDIDSDDNMIYALYRDHSDFLWVGTKSGLKILSPDLKKIINFPDDYPACNLPKNDVVSFYEDLNNHIWISVENDGIFRFNKTDSSFTKLDIPYEYTGRAMYNDSLGNMWIATNIGLIKMDIYNQQDYTIYTTKDGLPINLIFGILEDKNKNLWLSTGAGLVKYKEAIIHPEEKKFINYTLSDGLQSSQFTYNGYFKSKSGEMFFGGINGFNSFYPDEVKNNPITPNVVLIGLRIYNDVVNINDTVEGKKILDQTVQTTSKLVLSYKYRMFSLEFAALHYAQPYKNKYMYKMEGFDQEWSITNAENNYATYTNLPGGEYLFKVKACNNDGIWNEIPCTLKIKIIPPFWETILFKILAAVIIFILALLFYLNRIRRLKSQKIILENTVSNRTSELKKANDELLNQTVILNQTNVQLEEIQMQLEEQSEELKAQKEELQSANDHLIEINSTKDRLFSIVAHDIKNPFSSILGFCQLLVKKYDKLTVEKQRTYIDNIYYSALTLYSLLEKLLQWSRSQTGQIKVNLREFLFLEIFEDISKLYKNQLKEKNIDLISNFSEDLKIVADFNIIETVLRNLVGNAVKFTENGEIIIIAAKIRDNFEICIKDTGIGIEKSKLDKLFTVEQVKSSEGTHGEAGTGLGLIICKEFIEKCGGKINVTSELGKGSTFTIILPAENE